jgi:SAGA-associated factor 11
MGQNKAVLEEIMNELLDEISLGLCFELHRSCKIGTFFLDDTDLESEKLYEIVTIKGHDVFGQLATAKKQYDCVCPNCKHNLAASRFAPHLEKCMGMGTSGARVTSQRMARSSNKKGSEVESDDNSNDGDWTYSGDKKVGKKAKKDKRVITSKKTKIKTKLKDDIDPQQYSSDSKTERSAANVWDMNSSSPADSSSTIASVKSSRKRKHSKSTRKKKSSTGSGGSFSP